MEDATPEVLAQMLLANENATIELTFEKGTYHFYPNKALEVFSNISNHNDVFVFTAFPIFNLNNLTNNGNGFHGLMVPFLIDWSENIRLKNLNIAWATPFHSEGLVVENDQHT